MASDLANFLRKLRIDNDEFLGDMAKKLFIAPSTLSAYECERRKAPAWFAQMVYDVYNLTPAEKDKLLECIANAKIKPRSDAKNKIAF